MTVRELTVEMEVLTCECGIVYAVPTAWVKERREDHKTFYCPNGCRRWFPHKAEKEKLEERISGLQDRLAATSTLYHRARDEAEHNVRRFNGLKGYVEKLKRR